MASTKNTDKTGLQRELGLMIGNVSRAWRYEINQRLKPFGLNQSMQQVLLQLHRHPGGLVQSALARKLGIEGPTLVRLLDQLEKHELIRREALPDDKRMKNCVLTSKATRQIRIIEDVMGELRATMMRGLDPVDIESALAIMEHMHRNLSGEDG